MTDDDLDMEYAAVDAEYAAAWPKITRTLKRLCDQYGFDMVLGIFSNDMPEHREEREREEREQRALREQRAAMRRELRRVHVAPSVSVH